MVWARWVVLEMQFIVLVLEFSLAHSSRLHIIRDLLDREPADLALHFVALKCQRKDLPDGY